MLLPVQGSAEQPTEAGYAMSLAELRAKLDDDLVRDHDAIRTRGIVSVEYYLDELARRRSDRQAARVERQTQTMVRLTWVIAALTVANVVLVAVSLCK